MLPQTALQQPQIIQQNTGGHDSPHLHPHEPTRLQPLPYRGSQGQHSSAALTPLQRMYHPDQTRTEPQKLQAQVKHLTGLHSFDASEHMLRRKTPNGTLAAGYDGTPVQWSTKPPASKHIVLPTSRPSLNEGPSLKNDLNGVNQHGQSAHEVSWHHRSPLVSVHGTIGIPNGANGDWTRLPPLISGSNSIFDRIPMQQAPTYFHYDGNAIQVPAVLQPPYQPCSGPTASNDGGFYGPYWPDGKFVPYRPAAFRHIAYQNSNQIEVSRQIIPSLMYEDPRRFQQTGPVPQNADSFNTRPRLPSIGNADDTDTISLPSKSLFIGQQQLTLPENGVLYSPGQPGLYNPISLLNGTHQNAQFKEKALAWAHKVYVDLLSYLQHVKKNSQQARRSHGLGRSYSQTSIYPKPPRQSSFSTVRSSTDHYGQMDSKLASVPRFVASTGRRSSHPFTHQVEQNRSSGNSATVENAKYALEILTNLCRESEWRWIDGMLLGGCLAYGLEDYQKALDWYTKIVSIDRR